MRRFTGTAVALASAVVLLSAASASAGSQGSAEGAPPKAQITPEQGYGTVSGSVSFIDEGKGRIDITNKGRVATLHAAPDEVAALKLGQQVSLDFIDYNGQHWIDPQSLGAGATGQGLEQRPLEHASGAITRLDKGQGTFSVDGRSYLARPETLAGLNVRDAVALRYANVEGNRWVVDVERAGSKSEGVGGTGQGNSAGQSNADEGPSQE